MPISWINYNLISKQTLFLYGSYQDMCAKERYYPSLLGRNIIYLYWYGTQEET